MSLSKNIFLSNKNKPNPAKALFTTVLLLVALATILFCVIGVTGVTFYTWKQNTYNTVVVQIFSFNLPSDTETTEETSQAPDSALLALEKLKELPFVKKAALLSEEQMLNLVSGWFTNAGILESLNLPSIFTIELSAYSKAPLLKEAVQEISQDFTISDHAAVVKGVVSIFDSLFIVSIFILSLMILLIFFVVSTVCRFIVFTEKESITILSNLGARDKQISGLLQHRVTFISSMGAFFGYLLAALALTILFFSRGELFVFASLHYVFFILLFSLLIPIFTILLSAFVSYRA